MGNYWLRKTKRYKRHFLCFQCRKNFKKPNEKDLAEANGELSILLNAFYYSKPKKKVSKELVQYLKEKYFNTKEKCPECALEMVEVPMSYETPTKKNINEWRNLKIFYNAEGFVKQHLPVKKKEFIEYLEETLSWHIKMVQNVENHRSRKESVGDARTRIRQNIETIRGELAVLKKEK